MGKLFTKYGIKASGAKIVDTTIGAGTLNQVLSLSPSSSTSWRYYNSSLSSTFVGKQARIVLRYYSGTNYTGDFQIDDLNIGGNSFNFESTTGWQRQSTAGSTVSTYSSILSNLGTVSSGTSGGLWNQYNGTPGSSGTGIAARSGYYMYCETSSPGYSNKYFWLVSPLVDINNTTFNF